MESTYLGNTTRRGAPFPPPEFRFTALEGGHFRRLASFKQWPYFLSLHVLSEFSIV